MITACSLSGFCCPGRERTLLFAPLLDLDDRAIPQHGSFATRPQHRAIPQHGALDEPQPRLLTHPAWGGVVHVARQEGRTADLLLSTSRTLFHLESPPSACGRASCPFWPAAAAVAPKPVSSLFLPAWPPPRQGVEPRTTPRGPPDEEDCRARPWRSHQSRAWTSPSCPLAGTEPSRELRDDQIELGGPGRRDGHDQSVGTRPSMRRTWDGRIVTLVPQIARPARVLSGLFSSTIPAPHHSILDWSPFDLMSTPSRQTPRKSHNAQPSRTSSSQDSPRLYCCSAVGPPCKTNLLSRRLPCCGQRIARLVPW
jgi:hypothetical protein